MKTTLTIFLSLLVIAGTAFAEDIATLSLDDAGAIGLSIDSDPVLKTEGEASVRISTIHPTTICLGEIAGLDVENAKLIYRAKVRSKLEGAAYLEMWVHVGGSAYFSRGMNDPIKGTSDWKTIQTPFIFQQGQKPDKVTLNIVIEGRGTVWVDEVVLSVSPLN